MGEELSKYSESKFRHCGHWGSPKIAEIKQTQITAISPTLQAPNESPNLKLPRISISTILKSSFSHFIYLIQWLICSSDSLLPSNFRQIDPDIRLNPPSPA